MSDVPADDSTRWEDDALAIEYLRGCGYRLTNRYNWLVPNFHSLVPEERTAAQYLRDEWDFGWFTWVLDEGEVAYD